MRRFFEILINSHLYRATTLTCVFALAGIELCGCANSPYRQVMREMNQPAAARLAARIREVSKQHEAAMEQFDTTATLLIEISARESSPTEWDLFRCRDAVELCDWWIFNLDRVTRSIEDLLPQSTRDEPAYALSHGSTANSTEDHAESDSVGVERYRDLITGFDHVREMMRGVSRELAAVAESLAASSAGERTVDPCGVPDLASLREVVAGMVQQAEAAVGPPVRVDGADASGGN